MGYDDVLNPFYLAYRKQFNSTSVCGMQFRILFWYLKLTWTRLVYFVPLWDL